MFSMFLTFREGIHRGWSIDGCTEMDGLDELSIKMDGCTDFSGPLMKSVCTKTFSNRGIKSPKIEFFS